MVRNLSVLSLICIIASLAGFAVSQVADPSAPQCFARDQACTSNADNRCCNGTYCETLVGYPTRHKCSNCRGTGSECSRSYSNQCCSGLLCTTTVVSKSFGLRCYDCRGEGEDCVNSDQCCTEHSFILLECRKVNGTSDTSKCTKVIGLRKECSLMSTAAPCVSGLICTRSTLNRNICLRKCVEEGGDCNDYELGAALCCSGAETFGYCRDERGPGRIQNRGKCATCANNPETCSRDSDCCVGKGDFCSEGRCTSCTVSGKYCDSFSKCCDSELSCKHKTYSNYMTCGGF